MREQQSPALASPEGLQTPTEPPLAGLQNGPVRWNRHGSSPQLAFTTPRPSPSFHRCAPRSFLRCWCSRRIDRPAGPPSPRAQPPPPARALSTCALPCGDSIRWEGRLPPGSPHTAAASRRTRAPAKASTQRGGSPRQADRSPAWNRRLLRRGHTGWEVAGGERPVRNHVPCLTGHTVNPIRPRRPASLPVLCQRAPMQNVFCMGTQARAMTHVGSCPSACGQGSLACGPLQRKA